MTRSGLAAALAAACLALCAVPAAAEPSAKPVAKRAGKATDKPAADKPAGDAQAKRAAARAPRTFVPLPEVEETGSVTSAAQEGGSEPLPITPAASRPAANPQAVVDRANAALNSVSTMTADFSQTGEGRRLTGTVYVQRPGKLRFEYNKPSTLEVVSDGSTVLVRDRKLNTSDPYPVSQTPLKFLLSSRIDLGRESRVRSVSSDAGGVNITIEDSSTLGGTSRITLTFDPEITTLKRWRVVDPQGYTTTVALSDIEKNRAIDPRTFQLNYSRPVE